MIYVSTGGFHELTAIEAIKMFEKFKIQSIELSGGRPLNGIENSLLEYSHLNLAVHNYFPSPSVPFVFNLATDNPELRNRSIQHAMNSIELAKKLGSNVYSFHAGFLMDPDVSELGKTISKKRIIDRTRGLDNFISAVNEVDLFAKNLGVSLYIENNVLSNSNLKSFGLDPLLMTQSHEAIEIMKQTSPNTSILVDVAHLKVSAQTLNFDKLEFLELCDEWISGYHLSDNDGTADQNLAISENSWFWPYLKRNVNYHSLEIYNIGPSELRKQLDLAKRKLEKP